MPVDVKLTMRSGQTPTFIFSQVEDKFIRTYNGKIVEVWQDEKFKLKTNNKKFFNSLFRQQDDLQAHYDLLSLNDDFMSRAIQNHYGLRLTKSDYWEAITCFILSSNKSVPAIRSSVQKLMMKFGEKNDEFFEFPSVEAIARANMNDLMSCGLGYRAPYLKETAKIVSKSDIKFEDYNSASDFLLSLPGVGPKVRDCVLLYGYGFMQAFPIDVWIKRGMQEIYFNGKETEFDLIDKHSVKLWGNLRGLAQLYLFYEFMSSKGDSKIKKAISN